MSRSTDPVERAIEIGRSVGRLYALACCWVPMIWVVHNQDEWSQFGRTPWWYHLAVLVSGLLGLIGTGVVASSDKPPPSEYDV